MAEVIQDGKIYIDLTTLAHDTGYDREYLRKLAKASKVDAIQIDWVWLINPEDLKRYAGGYKSRGPRVPQRKTGPKPKPKNVPKASFVSEPEYVPFVESA